MYDCSKIPRRLLKCHLRSYHIFVTMQKFVVTLDNKSDVGEKVLLPIISDTQYAIIETLSDPLHKAQKVIDILGNIHPGPSDPEIVRKMDQLDREDAVRNLLWSLIDECETYGSSLFKHIHTGHLLELLYADQ